VLNFEQLLDKKNFEEISILKKFQLQSKGSREKKRKERKNKKRGRKKKRKEKGRIIKGKK